MASVVKYDNIDFSKINYSKPEKIGNSYFGSISYDSSVHPLYIQSARVKSLVNGSDIKDKKNPFLEFELMDGSLDFYDFILSIDDENIKRTTQNSELWFNKEIPHESIEDMYSRISKPCKKHENPRLKLKLPVIQNTVQCAIYNQNRIFIGMDEIKKGSELILIIHIRGLKVLKQSFICDCYVSQIKLFQENNPSYTVIQEYSIIDDEKDDYDDIFSQEFKEELDETSKQKKTLREKKEESILEKEFKVRQQKLHQEKMEKERIEKEKKEEEQKKLELIEKERLEKERIEKIKILEQELQQLKNA